MACRNIKITFIRVDLLVGLGAKEVLENYPWLTEKQVNDALDFASDVITQKGRREASTQQIFYCDEDFPEPSLIKLKDFKVKHCVLDFNYQGRDDDFHYHFATFKKLR